MIESLEIQGLRGIREGKIEGLAPLTVLVGPNGCGKSTVLEAAGVACGGGSPVAVFRALACREWLGLKGLSLWFDPSKGFRVKGAWTPEPGQHAVLKEIVRSVSVSIADLDAGSTNAVLSTSQEAGAVLRFNARLNEHVVPKSPPIRSTDASVGGWAGITEDGNVIPRDGTPPIAPFSLHPIAVDRPAGAGRRMAQPRFSSALREALTRLKLSPLYDDFFAYLQVRRPPLVSIESIAVGDRDEPFFFEKSPTRVGYPLAYAGDGFRRSLLIASTLVEARGGVAAMDEPEAFAHPRMFTALARLIHRAIDDGTQVMVATHSLEFVAALLSEFEGQPDKACVVGLTMDDGVLDPLVVAGPEAYKRVVEWKDDLRL